VVLRAVPLGAFEVAESNTFNEDPAARVARPAMTANLTLPSGQRLLTVACTLAIDAAT
jgi:hypothetical protein